MPQMHAIYLMVPILCILVIAYRYYSAFIAAISDRGMSARKGASASVLAFLAPLVTLWIFAH